MVFQRLTRMVVWLQLKIEILRIRNKKVKSTSDKVIIEKLENYLQGV